MVLIPAGEYWMGRTHTTSLEQAIILERDRRDDQPAHKIYIDAFYLDTHEVTNADYARFVAATNAAKPWHWPKGVVAKEEERWPVTNVTWAEAEGYCGGQASACRRRPNGNEPRAAGWTASAIHGATKAVAAVPIPDRRMDPQPSVHSRPTHTVCSTWPATSGNGRATGTSAITTPSAPTEIPPVQRPAAIASSAAVAGPKARRWRPFRNYADPEMRTLIIGFRCAKGL